MARSTPTESLLPLIWNELALVGFDVAFRNAMDGNLALEDGQRESVIGLSENIYAHWTDDETGEYLGPVALFPEYAKHLGCVMWTPDAMDIFGEAYMRRILGDRILSGVNHGRYATLINEATGKLEAVQLIAELHDADVVVMVGDFDKSASLTDKGQWVFTPQAVPSLSRPTGVDITLARQTNEPLTIPQVEYLQIVIARVLPYWLVDVRISTLFVAPSTFHVYAVTPRAALDYGIVGV